MINITERVAEIQSKLNAPKNQNNTFGGYKYRSCEDILMAVKPLLCGLIVTITDDIVAVGERVYVKATASISDGEHKIECSAFAREAFSKKGMDDAQVTGSTSSYARKYALNGLFLIDDNKDADTQDNRDSGKPHAAIEHAHGEDSSAGEPNEADAVIVAQMNAAKSVPELVKVMNGLQPGQKKLITPHFNARMGELKKAA